MTKILAPDHPSHGFPIIGHMVKDISPVDWDGSTHEEPVYYVMFLLKSGATRWWKYSSREERDNVYRWLQEETGIS